MISPVGRPTCTFSTVCSPSIPLAQAPIAEGISEKAFFQLPNQRSMKWRCCCRDTSIQWLGVEKSKEPPFGSIWSQSTGIQHCIEMHLASFGKMTSACAASPGRRIAEFAAQNKKRFSVDDELLGTRWLRITCKPSPLTVDGTTK
jgi:hypothetical protein